MGQVAPGTLIQQDVKDDTGTVTGQRAGIYLGEDANGTGLWAPFATVEKVEPGDFDSAPDTFVGSVNAGPKIKAPAQAAVVAPTEAEVAQAQAILARANAAASQSAGLEVG